MSRTFFGDDDSSAVRSSRTLNYRMLTAFPRPQLVARQIFPSGYGARKPASGSGSAAWSPSASIARGAGNLKLDACRVVYALRLGDVDLVH